MTHILVSVQFIREIQRTYTILDFSKMEPQEFLRVLSQVLPSGVRPTTKAEWVQVCEALELPTDVGVAEMIESIYTQKGIMLMAHRTGEGPEKQKVTEGAEGGVSILKDLLTVITESNMNTHAMLCIQLVSKRNDIS